MEGKSQTNYPGIHGQKPYVESSPGLWFHDVFRTDGTPYLREETDLIKRTGQNDKRKLWAEIVGNTYQNEEK